jgi:catechol 2,3-dioxygenase-like lactoylglutathione lyase family enzyme
MHRSRLAGYIIDCQTDNLEEAAEFWSAALGYKRQETSEDDLYLGLDTPDGDPYIEVQTVDHASRIHLDIESDNIEAEVQRLEALGARRIEKIKTWVVMEAPTGQRFCVINRGHKYFDETANRWE